MKRVSFTNEYLFKASPTILYRFVTTPSCLIRWFCDEVDITGEMYTFFWNGAEEVAEMIDDIEDERVRFKWDESSDNEYLEFRFGRSPVTGETILEITGFCDEDDKEAEIDYWNNQVKTLRQETGG